MSSAQLPAVPVSQSPEDKFREFLASRPRAQRFTAQQRDMVRFIFSRHNHFDADQLTEDLRRAEMNVSRATVYRTLTKLVEAGLLRCLETGPRKFYEHDYGYPQHYHLQCNICEEMIEFENATIEAIVREMARTHQFQATQHTFSIRGVCGNCNRARASKRRLDLI